VRVCGGTHERKHGTARTPPHAPGWTCPRRPPLHPLRPRWWVLPPPRCRRRACPWQCHHRWQLRPRGPARPGPRRLPRPRPRPLYCCSGPGPSQRTQLPTQPSAAGPGTSGAVGKGPRTHPRRAPSPLTPARVEPMRSLAFACRPAMAPRLTATFKRYKLSCASSCQLHEMHALHAPPPAPEASRCHACGRSCSTSQRSRRPTCPPTRTCRAWWVACNPPTVPCGHGSREGVRQHQGTPCMGGCAAQTLQGTGSSCLHLTDGCPP
jgi:hypothetical protein